MFEKALKIDTQTFNENHESLALSNNNIGSIYQQINDLSKALYHVETGLMILLRSQARDNVSLLAKHQFNLGIIQFQLGNNVKALNMIEKTLKNQLIYLPESHERRYCIYISVVVKHIHATRRPSKGFRLFREIGRHSSNFDITQK